MIEQFGPAADAQVAYLQERAASSFRHANENHGTLLHWLRRHSHRGETTRP
ncbi:hypothetical protein [Luteimicrobium sp. DT211]|uniref:hypothetical protein n=1 Tax=Luteimicrobium sp. DT211 TaxID=3393412 RepID=UPI003CEFBCEE